MNEDDAISEAARVLRVYGIDIALPWDGDLDDLERERYEGLVEACHAYIAALNHEELYKALTERRHALAVDDPTGWKELIERETLPRTNVGQKL